MRILDLELPVSDCEDVGAYFRDVLELPVSGGAVGVGWSTIRLVPAAGRPTGGVHLAFNVPFDRFDEAVAWLKGRTVLQRDPAGQEIFTFDESWDACSVYFTGPDDLVLELIARRRLPVSGRRGVFVGSELVCMSEVGLPVASVGSVCAQAADAFGLAPLGKPSDQFAAMGDDQGLLILSSRERCWFPEARQRPNGAGLKLRIQASGAQGLPLIGEGWNVSAV